MQNKRFNQWPPMHVQLTTLKLYAYHIAGSFRGVKNSKTVVFVSNYFVQSHYLHCIHTFRYATPTLKFRGGQLTHENKEYFTPRKLPANTVLVQSILCSQGNQTTGMGLQYQLVNCTPDLQTLGEFVKSISQSSPCPGRVLS